MGRLKDRFDCTSQTEHRYDWAFHAPGKLTVSVETKPASLPYKHLKNVGSAKTDSAFTARWEGSGDGPALVLRLEAAPGTEVFTAVGPGRDPVDEVPVLIVRRQGKSATFAVTHQLEPAR